MATFLNADFKKIIKTRCNGSFSKETEQRKCLWRKVHRWSFALQLRSLQPSAFSLQLLLAILLPKNVNNGALTTSTSCHTWLTSTKSDLFIPFYIGKISPCKSRDGKTEKADLAYCVYIFSVGCQISIRISFLLLRESHFYSCYHCRAEWTGSTWKAGKKRPITEENRQ